MKRKIKHFTQVILLPYILSLFIRLIYLTNKKIFHFPKNRPKKSFILAMWHGELLMQPLNYRMLKPNGQIKVIVSEHRDGEMIRKVVNLLGVGAIAGSSTRGGVKALIGAIKTIKQGIDVAITPDGPRGPRHEIADGIVIIAQKTGAQILTCSLKASKYWQFNSWDKFMVPKPFGEINFYISDPFDISGLNIEEAKKTIKIKMMENSSA
ncbi:Protein of unknown function DUF374 [hydrothermal vent metagenome]|uniref:DUF374 domain-containing protein n=1 Tax=hydrothermal vent metagenome TaxID=652676 RepID=A0A3B1EAC5_9ZZZZ